MCFATIVTLKVSDRVSRTAVVRPMTPALALKVQLRAESPGARCKMPVPKDYDVGLRHIVEVRKRKSRKISRRVRLCSTRFK